MTLIQKSFEISLNVLRQMHEILCDPMDYSPLDSCVHRIFQARIPEWVAISSSRDSFQLRDRICLPCVSCIGRHILYHYSTWEARIKAC